VCHADDHRFLVHRERTCCSRELFLDLFSLDPPRAERSLRREDIHIHLKNVLIEKIRCTVSNRLHCSFEGHEQCRYI
jgi:hypothetical protein